jgi:hypothetical protein
MFQLIKKSSGLLFSSHDLRQIIDSARASLRAEVDQFDQNRLLNTAPADLVRYLVERYSITPPALRREDWSATELETQVDVRYDSNRWIRDTSRPVYIPGQRIEIEVPIEGDIELMYARSSTFSSSPPRAQVRGQVLTLAFEIPHDAAQRDIRQEAERILSEIEQHLQWIRNDLAGFNSSLQSVAETAITARRERILTNQGRVASLGIPLKRRDNAPKTFVTPEVRKKVVPTLPTATSAAFVPEPALDMQMYEHILVVLQNMAHVMERSPSAFRSMGEEDLRQHFLVQLNGQFEGSATGETFNVGGKTDILLRANGCNVFIAECKFWKGPKHYRETIDQLLSYTAWRDTKTAILVFNRGTTLSTVINGITTETERHANFKRLLEWKHETGLRCVLHHPSDTNRELTLTVLVFDVPSEELAPE